VPGKQETFGVENPQVNALGGRVEGFRVGRVAAFLGVPYALPPVGELRFQAPRPHPPWEGVRRVTSCGAPCAQTNPDLPAWLDPNPDSEDCLVLNVWTPALPGSPEPVPKPVPRPVMVWLHGGAFSYGSAGVPLYDGARLAEQGDVVVVSVNHRLNAFGYAWFGDLIPDLAAHANPGQRDIELALRWVRDNVAAFGGDPGNVTVFGESGGGAKIGALCASPSASGLFDKMIIQSGAQTSVHDRDQATGIARQLLRELGMARPSPADLASVTTGQWKTAVAAVEARLGALAFQPVVDGTHLTGQPWNDEALRATAHLPLLIGTTSDETAAFLPDALGQDLDETALLKQLRSFFLIPPLSAGQCRQLLDAYRRMAPGRRRAQLLVAMTTDLSFWGSTQQVLDVRAATAHAATYSFEFAWNTPCFGSKWSPHGGELPFLFGSLEYPSAWDGQDNAGLRAAEDPAGDRHRLSAELIAAWAAFARNGEPSTATFSWPRWSGPGWPTIVLGRERQPLVEHRDAARWQAISPLPRGW
jgi:para-nitrobenzyl esterase